MKFSVSIPALDPSSPRFNHTLSSITSQLEILSKTATAEVFIVTPRADLLKAHFEVLHPVEGVEIRVVSDQGQGLYAALATSFSMHTGDVHSYLGSGDAYEPQTFSVVSEIFGEETLGERAWLTGIIASRREDGAIVRATLPARYHAKGFAKGRYGRVAPSIQQESTWWTNGLHKTIPLERLSRFRLAGDYFLWQHFAQYAEPYVVECILGSFQWHGDNMSSDWKAYLDEMNTICPRLQIGDKLAALSYTLQWALPNRWKVRTGKGRLLRWNWPDGPWSHGV